MYVHVCTRIDIPIYRYVCTCMYTYQYNYLQILDNCIDRSFLLSSVLFKINAIDKLKVDFIIFQIIGVNCKCLITRCKTCTCTCIYMYMYMYIHSYTYIPQYQKRVEGRVVPDIYFLFLIYLSFSLP